MFQRIRGGVASRERDIGPPSEPCLGPGRNPTLPRSVPCCQTRVDGFLRGPVALPPGDVKPGVVGPVLRAAALPATVPLDHANWKLNAGLGARPSVAIGHCLLRSVGISESALAVCDRCWPMLADGSRTVLTQPDCWI